MANKIQIRRGLKANLPTLSVGELALCTDTNELYIGTNGGNVSADTTARAIAGGAVPLVHDAGGVRTLRDVVSISNVLTGILKIDLPVTWSNSMMRIRISGYNYGPDVGAWELLIGGYNFAGDVNAGVIPLWGAFLQY